MKKTEEEKAVVISVTQQVVNMLVNDVIDGNGIGCFEGWCEDGDIFDEGCRDKCIELMHKVAPIVDRLTYEYLNLGY